MFLFGYSHTWGYAYPGDNEICRVMIFPGKNNNVLVWRGYDEKLTQYTVNKEVIWEIEGLIEQQMELTDAEKSKKEYVYALDVPMDSFAFMDGEGRLRVFSDAMLGCEKGKDAGVDKIIDLVLKIQEILKRNGVDVIMLAESDLDNYMHC